LARNAVATALLSLKEDFADTNFLTSLPRFINNPSVAGFMIEKAVLSSIRSNGLAIGAGIHNSMEVVMFRTKFPPFKGGPTDRPVLYCPEQFNFPTIDGIVIWLEGSQKPPKKRGLKIFPLQITIAPDTHSDSHDEFFGSYEEWINLIKEDFDLKTEFVWITPDPSSFKIHRKKYNRPRHLERYMSIKEINYSIWELYLDAKKNPQTQEVPENFIGGQEQGGSEEHMGSNAGGSGNGGERGEVRENRRREYQKMKKGELQELLGSRSLPDTGKKDELVNRLLGDDMERARATLGSKEEPKIQTCV
jgi:hypothetical protein